MSQGEAANVHFGPVCGGYLPQGVANSVRSEHVRGCNATAQGDGVWLIEPHDRSITDYGDMIVSFNIAPDAAAGPSPTLVLGPFISTSAVQAPDFYIGTFFEDTPPTFVDVALCFEVKRIPRNR